MSEQFRRQLLEARDKLGLDKAPVPDAPPPLSRLLASLHEEELCQYLGLADYLDGSAEKELYVHSLLAKRGASEAMTLAEQKKIEQIVFRAEIRKEYNTKHGNWKPPSKFKS